MRLRGHPDPRQQGSPPAVTQDARLGRQQQLRPQILHHVVDELRPRVEAPERKTRGGEVLVLERLDGRPVAMAGGAGQEQIRQVRGIRIDAGGAQPEPDLLRMGHEPFEVEHHRRPGEPRPFVTLPPADVPAFHVASLSGRVVARSVATARRIERKDSKREFQSG